MVTLYDECTVSYIECKLRNVKKEEGYLNDFLHSIVSLTYTNHAKFIYIWNYICICIYKTRNLNVKLFKLFAKFF